MRALLVGAVVLSACGPAEVVPPHELAAPRLEGRTPTPFPSVLVHGSPGDGAVLRLYFDEACAGPVAREVSAEALVAGVEVQLVPRAVNVFTARGYSLDGRRSACSEPLRVESTPLDPPPRPTLLALRLGTGKPSGRFLLKGTVSSPVVRVRLFEEVCGGAPWVELTPEQFAHGVVATVPPNRIATFFAQSVDETSMRSDCASASVYTDTLPPLTAELRVLSINPVRAPWAWLYVGGFDFAGATLFNGPNCDGTYSSACLSPRECFFQLPLFDTVTRWSAQVYDDFGNTTCFDSNEELVAEPDDVRAQEAPVLELRSEVFANYLSMRVPNPVRFPVIKLYDRADCEGPPYEELNLYDATRARFVDPGTVWSARARRAGFDGFIEEGKCSNTILVPP